MTFNLNFLRILRSNQVTKSVCEISWWCWSGSVSDGGLSASKGCLRRFLMLKLVTVLLFPHTAGLPLLVGCVFSLQALLLLRSPRISTKPSTVLLGQLALTDCLVLLRWTLGLNWWMGESGCDIVTGLAKESVWWRESVSVLCQQLLDAHHLASLLLLGLLGLEATLVSRWPQQTRRFRTSYWAQLSCSLVWIFVLLELLFSLHLKLLQEPKPLTQSSTQQNSSLSNTRRLSLCLVHPSSLPVFSSGLRMALWLVNLRLHYSVLCNKPQKRRSSFH